MTTEYRIILTATFDGADARDAFYDQLKVQVAGVNDTLSTAKKAVIEGSTQITGSIKRADMTKDEYMVAEKPDTEQVI